MSNEAGARAIEKMMKQFGCLPDAPDGPVIPRFQVQDLAAALQSELTRCGEYGWSKVTLHMDLPDAVALLKFLKGEVI